MNGLPETVQTFANLPKKGLVLGGGGSKGCYHVGAWQAFKENGISFDAVTGTSIGALVGSFYVQQNIEPVTDFVMGMTPTEIARELPKLPVTMKEKVMGTRTILEFIMKYKDDKMDITPLKDHFDSMFDYDLFSRSPISYACMTFNDTRQEPRGFHKDEITKDNAKAVIMASAACYPAFPKVEYEGDLYMDGGFADNVPISLMKEIEPDLPDEALTVIDLHNPSDPLPPSLGEKMFYIQPIVDPGNSIDFATEHAMRLYNQGYLETLKYLGKNPGWLYTFLPEDKDLMAVVEKYLDMQMQNLQVVLPNNLNMPEDAVAFAAGYTPFALPNAFNETYEYGKLIEALALLAKVEPVALYDYKEFLKQVVEGLNALRLTRTYQNDFKMVEMFANLKRDELTVQLHRMLAAGQGTYPFAVERIKERIPSSYTLAYIWYFLEQLVAHLS